MHPQTPPGRPVVKLRTEQFKRYAESQGLNSDREIAAAVGVHRTMVMKLLRGDHQPGERVIASLLAAFPDRRFEDFFEVTDGSDPEPEPAARRAA
jgi:transcriptional regulator with XRE-family HTH domain